MAIGKFLAPLNGQIQTDKPYVDDIFDPLFNAEVRDYYGGLYGPVGGVGAAYAAMLENALAGRKGILGPGMGILSTFGRSMDKADDFILGGLTEGVNALGQITGGTNETPQNPFKRIFVDDYDYQGTKLMAAMGNSMAKLAGTQTPLDESDFQSLGDKVAGTTIDLATDPGIMGGQLARLNPNTPVGQVGQILNKYDDYVANVAGNMAFPGAKYLAGKGLTRIRDFLGGASSASPEDMVIFDGKWMSKEQAEQELYKAFENNYTETMGKEAAKAPYNTTARDIAEEYATMADITPLDEDYAILEEIRDLSPKYTDTARIPDLDDYATPSELWVYKKSKTYNDWLAKSQAQREALAKEIEQGHQDYLKGVSEDISNFVSKEGKYIDSTPVVGEDYTLPASSKYFGAGYLDPELRSGSKTITKEHAKHWVVSHNEINKVNASKKLKYLQGYVQELKSYDPHIFDSTYLKSAFPDMKYVPESPLRKLMSDNVGGVYYNNKTSKYTHRRYKELMNELHDSFIPWVKEHEHLLSKNKTGQRLIDFADDIENTLYKVNVSQSGKVRNVTGLDSIDLFNKVIDPDTGKEVYPLNIEQGDLVDVTTTTKVPITEVYSPLLQGLTSVTKDNDIVTLDEFIRLKKQYPHITLMLSEEGEGYYLKNLIDKETFKKLYPKFKDLPDDVIDQIIETEYSLKLTDMDEVYDRLPKEMYTPLGIPKTSTDLYKDLYKAVRNPTAAYTNLGAQNIAYEIADFTPNKFSSVISNPKSTQELSSINVLNDTFKYFKDEWNLDDVDPEDLSWYIRKYGTKKDKTLFGMWIAAAQSKVKNKLKTATGAFNIEAVKKSKQHIDDIVNSKHYTDDQIAEYISRKDLAEGVKISKDNFLESLWASNGFKEIPLDKTLTKEQQDAIAAALKRNVDKVNKYGNILKFSDVTEKSGTRRLAVFFDTDNFKIKKDINQIYSLFGKKDLGLEDVILRNPRATVTEWDASELDSAFDEMRQVSEDLSRKLGYTKVSPNYISHAITESEDAAKAFSEIYKSLGIDKEALDKLTQALKEQDIASGKLQFGAIPMERSHLGYFNQYHYTKGGKTFYSFSTDLKNIHSSTFTNGMFDNTNAQTFFDLFLTDNFKLKQNFESVDKLKEALNLSEGNLNNLSIVKPRYNEAGKLIGFTKYDKFNDAALAKAFADDEAILVPDSVIGSLDRICKKDARMSNKVYRFINKYLTVPFKFGTLANPGFLAGNIQDAYFKQAVELSKKYGTDLGEELTNVAFSMRQVIQLNNSFSETFDAYRAFLKDTDFTKVSSSTKNTKDYITLFKKSKNMVDTLTIDQVLGNPELYRAFKEYINVHADPKYRKMANLYLFLNNNQTTTMFKNNNRDLEDLADMVTDNPYATPNNIFERIIYGDPSKSKVIKINGQFRQVQDKGFSTYGLYLNNPVSNGILKSSNTIENWMRSSTILNDLQHQGYTIDDICDILGKDKVTEKALRDKFKMSMNEAINTMYAANFDYDNISEFMNKASYILPFPTFYLKNLAFWADIFTNKPQLIDNVISTHEGLWAGKNTSKDEFTAEAKGRGAVPIGQQGLKHLTGIVKQTPYNSMFGAFNAVNNFKEDFAYRTNPILRPVARHLQDPKDIKYRPYNTNQYQKNITQADPEFSELAYMFHQMNPYERFVNTGLRTPGKVSRNEYQLSDFLPSMFQPDFNKKSKK